MIMEPSFHPSTVLVTGGAGFIGGNLIRWMFDRVPGIRIINLDLLTYAGNLESLSDVETQFGPRGDGHYRFVHGDIRDGALVSTLLGGDAHATDRDEWRPDAVLHLAAESHVDRSIMGAEAFVSTNVQGTLSLLTAVQRELELRPRPFRFINVSTDEVYGSLGPLDAAFTEQHPLRPNSPYSASKAGADCLVRAYTETFGLPCLTTRCSNNYGPYQFPEKLIPLMITKALRDEQLPVYGDGGNVRDWLHVRDHASAIWRVCTNGVLSDEVYNIGGSSERTNLAIVRILLAALGKPESLITYVRDRLGHDQRYAIDASRMVERLGWSPEYTLERGLQETLTWYVENVAWWERVRTEAYRATNALYS